jgi:hypothetical protein
MSRTGFDQVFQLVHSDPAVREEMLKARDLDALFATVLKLAKERGFDLEQQDLTAVANANRRAWLERWLE